MVEYLFHLKYVLLYFIISLELGKVYSHIEVGKMHKLEKEVRGKFIFCKRVE